jgi:hypothetical protein
MTEELLQNLGLNIDISKLDEILTDINKKLKNTSETIKQTRDCLRSNIRSDILMLMIENIDNELWEEALIKAWSKSPHWKDLTKEEKIEWMED